MSTPEYQAAWRLANATHHKAQQADYYCRNREKLRAANRARYHANRERYLANVKAYYALNRDACLARVNAWVAKNPARVLANKRRWAESNREELNRASAARLRHATATLSDEFVLRMLTQQHRRWGVPRVAKEQWPPEMIDGRRLRLALTRELKDRK